MFFCVYVEIFFCVNNKSGIVGFVYILLNKYKYYIKIYNVFFKIFGDLKRYNKYKLL